MPQGCLIFGKLKVTKHTYDDLVPNQIEILKLSLMQALYIQT